MADFYRVKNGNWNLADSWATTSGGTTYHAAPPTASDNAIFDANTPDGTHNINVSGLTCLDLDFTGFTGTLGQSFGSLDVYGSLTMSGDMTNIFNGNLTMKADTGTKTITSNGKNIGTFYIDGEATFQLADKLLITHHQFNATFGVSSAATFLHNDQEVEMGRGTYGIYMPSWIGESAENITFYDLVIASDANVDFPIGQNITVENELTVGGASATSRRTLRTPILGTQITIDAETANLTNINLRDIKGAGNFDWDLSGTTSGDLGGNEDITFTTAIDCYYVGGAANGNWSDDTKWKTTSGGATAARVPLPQDTAIVDANSFSGTRSLTIDTDADGKIDFSDADSDVSLVISSHINNYGGLDLSGFASISGTGNLYFYGRDDTYYLNTDGKTLNNTIYIYVLGGTLALKSDLNSSKNVSLNYGTFSAVDGANNHNLEFNAFESYTSYTRSVIMGSGIWEIAGSGNPWTISSTTNLTFNAGTSTIKLTGEYSYDRTFDGAGLTFYNIECNHTETTDNGLIIKGDNTWNDFKISAGRTVRFYREDTQTVDTFTAIGTEGNEITIKSDTTTNAILEKAGGGTITMDYVDIDYITGNPDDTWYASNSTIGANCSQIYEPTTYDRRRASFIKFF
jgi:hypothetical protein